MTRNIMGKCFLHIGGHRKIMGPKPQDRPHTTGEVAKLCGVSPRTIRRWVSEGRVRPQRTVGGHLRFTKRQIERLFGVGD